MKHVSDEAIDELLGCLDGYCLEHWSSVDDGFGLPVGGRHGAISKPSLRQIVRSWVQQHVSFRDIYAPQLQTKVPIQEVE